MKRNRQGFGDATNCFRTHKASRSVRCAPPLTGSCGSFAPSCPCWRSFCSRMAARSASTRSAGMPSISFTARFCSSDRNPTKQVPIPSSHATSSICCSARPASNCALGVSSVASAMTRGASPTNGPCEAISPIRLMASPSRTTTKCQGCKFCELGASLARLPAASAQPRAAPGRIPELPYRQPRQHRLINIHNTHLHNSPLSF